MVYQELENNNVTSDSRYIPDTISITFSMSRMIELIYNRNTYRNIFSIFDEIML